MDTKAAQLVMQYALALAAQSDEWADRKLGPIHLIKYLYLADLAHAERTGETFSGAPWRFFHFGPYCEEALALVGPAMEALGAEEHSFAGIDGDVKRWACPDPDVEAARIRPQLPAAVRTAVEFAVKRFGTDTSALLDSVYKTEPILRAAPGEALLFEQRLVGTSPSTPSEAAPTHRQLKKMKEARDRIRAEMAARKLARKPRRSTPMLEPRYDEVYQQGTEWLDGLAGGAIERNRGVVAIDDSVWTSNTRRDRDPA